MSDDKELELVEEVEVATSCSYGSGRTVCGDYYELFNGSDHAMVFKAYRKKKKLACKFKIGEVWEMEEGRAFVVTSISIENTIENTGLFCVSAMDFQGKECHFWETGLTYVRAYIVSSLVSEDAP